MTDSSSEDEKPTNVVQEDPKTRRRKRKRKTKESSQPAPAVSHANDDAEVDRTVFVEGIPYTCTREDVVVFFQDLEVIDCRLPTWQDTGRLRGYGHVVFRTRHQRDSALQRSGQYLNDRYLTIQPAQAPKNSETLQQPGRREDSEPSRTILLQNLSYDAVEQDVELVMAQFGKIVEGGIRILRHNLNKRSRGYGYVEYAEISSAQQAFEAPEIKILDRRCRLDYDHGTLQKNFRTATGRLWEKQYGKKRRSS